MIKEIQTTSEDIDKLHKCKKIANPTSVKYYENDVLILKCAQQSGVAIVRDGEFVKLPDVRITNHLYGHNLEQKIFLNYLYDPKVVCVVCTGSPGAGKTFLSMAFAYDSVVKGEFNNIVISRPPVAPSKKFQNGFIPGSLEEKMAPWLTVFYDNLNKAKQYMKNKTKVKIREQSLEYIKGLTFDNSIVIIDEAEDLTKQEVKAIMTRIGKNSKLILLGDIEQSTERGCKNTLPEVVKSFNKEGLNMDEQRMLATIDLKDSLRSEFVNLVMKIF